MAGESVLVIGGTGFIGAPLVAQLIEQGCDVKVISRRSGKRKTDGVRYLQGDVTDIESARRAVDGASIVYDLSAGTGLSWDEYERTIVGAARNVAQVCLEHGVRRLIYTSTIAALELSARSIRDESAGTDPKPHLRNWYARSKIYAEHHLMERHRQCGLPVVIFRPGMVVGQGNIYKLAHPGIGDWLSPTYCEVPGGSDTPLPFVLVEDVANALVLAKNAPGIEGCTFNLVGDARVSAAEYIDLLRQRTLRNFRMRSKPLLQIQLFRSLVWLSKALFRRRDNEWMSYHELKSAPKKTWLDCSAAKRLLGWHPVMDRNEFVRKAIDCHVPTPKPGDLRLSIS
ncbi:MAG TPA: NAD-dependent epimerase/dehydratase family protein [Myxococcales bacterium]|nr:NAD-dependent epimerase/dehydratase family protein [Myxococcales bacterium]